MNHWSIESIENIISFNNPEKNEMSYIYKVTTHFDFILNSY